jgi:hypothetical protein
MGISKWIHLHKLLFINLLWKIFLDYFFTQMRSSQFHKKLFSLWPKEFWRGVRSRNLFCLFCSVRTRTWINRFLDPAPSRIIKRRWHLSDFTYLWLVLGIIFLDIDSMCKITLYQIICLEAVRPNCKQSSMISSLICCCLLIKLFETKRI